MQVHELATLIEARSGVRMSAGLLAEVAHQIDCYGPPCEDNDHTSLSALEALRRIMQDADDPMCCVSQFREELLRIAIGLGIYQPMSDATLEAMVVSHGRKYAFKRNGVCYDFAGWHPLDALEPADQ